jgi:hypothetical protein
MNDEKGAAGPNDRNLLIAAIEQAFASIPLPGLITVCDPDCPECNDLTTEFQGWRWQDLDDGKIEANYSLSLFSPQAFCHFLPAYLRYALRHFNMDSRVCEFTVYAVTPSEEIRKNPSLMAWMRERLSGLDRKQAETVLWFLTLVSQDAALSDFHYDIEEGISCLKALLRDLKLTD